MIKEKSKAEILIGELQSNPNWKTLMSAELQKAIQSYYHHGAGWDALNAFEEQNYHDIAEAIHDEMKLQARNARVAKCYNCETISTLGQLNERGECAKCAKHTDPRSWRD